LHRSRKPLARVHRAAPRGPRIGAVPQKGLTVGAHAVVGAEIAILLVGQQAVKEDELRVLQVLHLPRQLPQPERHSERVDDRAPLRPLRAAKPIIVLIVLGHRLAPVELVQALGKVQVLRVAPQLVPAQDAPRQIEREVHVRLDAQQVDLAEEADQLVDLCRQRLAGEQGIAARGRLDDPKGARRLAAGRHVRPHDLAISPRGRFGRIVVERLPGGEDDPLKEVAVPAQDRLVPRPAVILGQAVGPHGVGQARLVGAVRGHHPAQVALLVKHARQGGHHGAQGVRRGLVQDAREQGGGEDIAADLVARPHVVGLAQHELGVHALVHPPSVAGALQEQALFGGDVLQLDGFDCADFGGAQWMHDLSLRVHRCCGVSPVSGPHGPGFTL